MALSKRPQLTPTPWRYVGEHTVDGPRQVQLLGDAQQGSDRPEAGLAASPGSLLPGNARLRNALAYDANPREVEG
jgi:hypothetical protein